MKFFRPFGILSISLLPAITTVVHAEEHGFWDRFESSGSVALTSDYLFRGISQTDEHFAIQGSVDLSFEVAEGLSAYVGAWGSNVDFDVDDPSAEIDVYGGFSGALGPIDWDLGGLTYIYPGAHGLSYEEAYLSLGHGFEDLPLAPSVTIGVNYSPENFASTGDAFYGHTSIDLSLPLDLTLNLHGARQWIQDNAGFGTPDYWDWSVSLSRNILGFDVSVGYYDTDIDGDECFGGTELCDARAVVTVGRSL